jgi:hypothetical protein
MATTTPNFGWPVPTSSDLVKNGATAIEGLGDAIDASLLDLKGGTTGQVLAKASGTDMDFSWVTDAAGMTNPMTTTGDVIYSSSGSTPARLGIGTAGQVLQVNSGATAPEWATPAGGGGKVLQVVMGQTSTAVTVASTTLADTGLTATITPTSATSKVLVLVSQSSYAERDATGAYCGVRLLRGGTNIYEVGGNDGLSFGIVVFTATLTAVQGFHSFNYLDSPATTSATTYKIQGRAETTANNGTSVFQYRSVNSSIILLEIGA